MMKIIISYKKNNHNGIQSEEFYSLAITSAYSLSNSGFFAYDSTGI